MVPKDPLSGTHSVSPNEAAEYGVCLSLPALVTTNGGAQFQANIVFSLTGASGGRELLEGGQFDRRDGLPRYNKCLSSQRPLHMFDLLALTN
jgi:hypothetical protein